MNDRPCKECIWRGEDGCTSWDCEPVTRKEAREMIKNLRLLNDASSKGEEK